MYCPNCSKEASTEQKFCRACGMELHAVAELVSGQSSAARPESDAHRTFQARHRATIIWGFILTFGSAAVGAGLKLLGKENIHPAGEFTPYVSVFFLLLAFIGMGLMSFPFLQLMSPGRKHAASSKSEPTTKLQPVLPADRPASVVEQTTEMLEAPELRARNTTPQSEDVESPGR